MFAGLVDEDAHAFDQEPDDLLPLGGRGRGRLPYRRQVTGQRPDHPLVVGREPAGGRALPARELVLELPLRSHRLLPATLQLAADQAILRLARLVLAGRT